MGTHRSLALTALTLIACIVTIQAEDFTPSNKIRRKRFACPDESAIPNCTCNEYGTESIFYCPRVNPTLDVRVNEVKQAVQLICREQYNFDTLPHLAIGNISHLVVKDCALDEERPILESFGFLGVNNIRVLLYDNYPEVRRIRYSPRYFEGLERLENLSLTRGVSGIQGDAFGRLPSLRRLYIQHNKLTFQRGEFDSLPNLVSLGLEYNEINHLEVGLFENLGKLETLSLARSKIKNISKEAFSGLVALRVLDLRVNDIESLDADVFALLSELSELHIGFNLITRLPEGLVSRNRKLQTFGLRINKKPLETLPEEFLANLPQLKTVHLDRNKIGSLPESLLRQSRGIIELNLSHNSLSSLPQTLLQDQHQLRELNLDHNLLESIPNELLENTQALSTLRLSYNRLQSLPESVFANLPNLKELHLENNNLQTIHQYTFSATTALEELYMQNNQLAFHATSFVHGELNIGDSDNTPFQYLSKLRTLKLRNNSISTIFLDWNVLNLELRELDLSYNRISTLSYADLQFQSNISVDLSNNKISQVYLAIDQLASLKANQKIKVDLSNNPLDCNCYVLGFVNYVQSERMQGLQFNTDLLRCVEPENLINMTIHQLQTEDLLCMLDKGCPVECSCDLRPVDHTIVINCTGRGLTRIPELTRPGLFEGFNSIELHAEDNLLTELPTSSLLGYDQVTQLHVRNNSIEYLLPKNFPASIRLLDLAQNQLQMIDESTVKFLNHTSNLSSIRLSNNRWRCDCPASHFLNFIQQNQNRIVDMPEVRCDFTGKSLDSITVNELCSRDLTRLIVSCVLIAVTGLMVGLFSILFYRYQIEVKVWLFTHNLFLWLITEEELDRDKLYDAFISYSHEDEHFITDHLVPTLEKEPMNFKTCWHVRDFMPGEMIMTQIVKSIEASRRTVIVLSQHFLDSTWAKEEFRQAHVQSMEDNRARVIVVIYEDIGDIEKLDSELKAYLKTNTYVKWGDPWFWDKLRYAMPHPLRVKGLPNGIHLEQVKATAPTAV